MGEAFQSPPRFAEGQSYDITTGIIQVNVDAAGNAAITEKFFLSFPNEFNQQEFRQRSEQLGVDLQGWEQFNAGFRPSVGNSENVVVSDIGFVENDSKYLEMKYRLNSPLMERGKETSRMAEFSLNPKFFNNFLQGSFWVIPSDTTIIIDLPVQAAVTESEKPEANVTGNRIVWTGYKSTNSLELKYVLWKQIASINLSEVIESIRNSEIFPVLAIAAALLAMAIFLKRKAITERIEKYVIEHSDLTGAEEEE